MNILTLKRAWSVVAISAYVVLSLGLSAQVQTETTTAKGKPTVVTKVERGEVVTVSGNDLVVKMADGTILNFENVPENVRVTVDGKQLSIHDLKPGMKLQRTIATTTTPMTHHDRRDGQGEGLGNQTPPFNIILTLEDGKNQRFKIPEGQKFNVDGQMVDAFALRKGMILTATKVVEEPVVEVTQQKTVTGSPAAPPPDVPVLVADGSEEAAPAATAEPAPVTAPAAAENASGFPTWVIWVVVLVVLAAIIWWFMSRKNRSQS